MNPLPVRPHWCLFVCALAGALIVWLLLQSSERISDSELVRPIGSGPLSEYQHALAEEPPRVASMTDEEVAAIVSEKARRSLIDRLVEQLLRQILAGRRSAIDGEAVVRFSGTDEFRAALDAVLGAGSKLKLLGEIETLSAIRIGYDDLDDLRRLLNRLYHDGIELEPNYTVSLPIYPIQDPDEPLTGASGGAPFGNSALRFLGVRRGENEGWGSGVLVAVLDSGIAPHTTFRDGQIIRIAAQPETTEAPGLQDIANGHGTAVASIIAGSDFRTPGVAPGVQLLSYRLLDDTGSGDSFTLAQMIADAVDSGADIINLSAGSYGDSQLVREMVTYATERHRLIIASAGNDAADVIVFPAAYQETVAVGAIDANREHLEFSNAGDQVDLAAPGLGVDAAWPGEQMVEFSGTSASAPFVTGAVAAMMSENPGMDPIRAWELLQNFTDDAGAPGIDSQLGRGSLNIGRAMERNERGIFDLAVASHYVDPMIEAPTVRVTVQNVGTEKVSNADLRVQSASRALDFRLPELQPGEIATRNFTLDRNAADGSGQLGVSSAITLPGNIQDRIPNNNLRQSVIQLPIAEPDREVTR